MDEIILCNVDEYTAMLVTIRQDEFMKVAFP